MSVGLSDFSFLVLYFSYLSNYHIRPALTLKFDNILRPCVSAGLQSTHCRWSQVKERIEDLPFPFHITFHFSFPLLSLCITPISHPFYPSSFPSLWFVWFLTFIMKHIQESRQRLHHTTANTTTCELLTPQQHNENIKAGHVVIRSWSYNWAVYLWKQLYLAQFRQVEAKTKCDRDRLNCFIGHMAQGTVLLSVISHLITDSCLLIFFLSFFEAKMSKGKCLQWVNARYITGHVVHHNTGKSSLFGWWDVWAIILLFMCMCVCRDQNVQLHSGSLLLPEP